MLGRHSQSGSTRPHNRVQMGDEPALETLDGTPRVAAFRVVVLANRPQPTELLEILPKQINVQIVADQPKPWVVVAAASDRRREFVECRCAYADASMGSVTGG